MFEAYQRLTRLPALLTLGLLLILATVGTFTAGIWAIGGLGSAIILTCIAWRIDRHFPQPSPLWWQMAIMAMVPMAALASASIDPALSWRETLRMATIFLPLVMLLSPAVSDRLDHQRLFPLLTIAITVGAAALGIELCLGGPLLHIVRGPQAQMTEYNRSLSYTLLIAIPCMAWLWQTKRRWLVAPFILILLFPASLTESRAAKLSLMLALPVILFAHYQPRRVLPLLGAFTTLCIGWPFAARYMFLNHHDWLARLPPSWLHRTEIWDYMSYRIAEKPWLGWGFGTSHLLDFKNPHGDSYVFAIQPAAHPHNVLIQLWVEMGLPGLAIGLLFTALTLVMVKKMKPHLMPFAAGAWVASLTLSLVAYSFWTDSLFCAFALTGTLFGILNRRKDGASA
ncbi:MAG: O-antigen ligase family protein [Alphaproteobacteria bacterium]|nr:O-antigen ligase family protein [Alphaproteobacteria bacterium]